MDRQKLLQQYIRRAQRSLNIEKMLPILQYGFLMALVCSSAILVVSRLFVFPYYRRIALILGLSTILLTLVVMLWKRVRRKEALTELDTYYPHNELVTALSFKEATNPLVLSLLQKAEEASVSAFQRFKRRKKQLWKVKALSGILVMVLFIGVLSIFPSATQQEAVTVEKEDKIINDLEKEVANLEEKAKTKEVKKQLQELTAKLKDTETSEEAVREVVKKQKELKLQEQQLKEREKQVGVDDSVSLGELTAEELKQLKELTELQSELANDANATQSALSKLGKPISLDLQNAIASEINSQSQNDASQNDSSANGQANANSSNNNSQKNNGQSQGNNGSTGQNGTTGNGNSSGQGNGQGNGSGSGNGNGNGSGTGSGSGSGGKGNGGGGSGSGAGLGQGSRDLLSVPERIGGSSETTVDSGPLGEGEMAGEQKGLVPVTKGAIRPYEEVVGEYKDSYLESSERMQLPKDLQDIVQSYFTTIESNE